VSDVEPRTALVVEGRAGVAAAVARALTKGGFQVLRAERAGEGLEALRTVQPDVVLLGLALDDLDAARGVDRFVQGSGDAPVLAIAAGGGTDDVVAAIRRGAADVLSPEEAEQAPIRARRALAERGSRVDLDRVQQQVRDRYGFSDLVSQSPRMLEVFEQVRKVAPTDATVLIRGETGTGKELVARAIHDRSRRKDRPFISVNCGAFTETLLESELFGHEKGSFTGAVGRREGLFEMADGGTLFLDELGETTPNVQVNLLRVLEEMTFRRVGGREPVQVDVRIVAATNVDLEEAVADGSFREDLFYRLNVYPIALPPLRHRREDIPLLLRHFLDEVSEEYSLEPPILASETVGLLVGHRWPGNVRQLRAMCERWVITRTGERLEPEHLPREITDRSVDDDPVGTFAIDDAAPLRDNLDRAAAQIERAYLFRLLQKHRGHLGKTAEAAGITRRTLYTKVREYGFDARSFKRGED
jgi:two-component system response regulator AtoC